MGSLFDTDFSTSGLATLIELYGVSVNHVALDGTETSITAIFESLPSDDTQEEDGRGRKTKARFSFSTSEVVPAVDEAIEYNSATHVIIAVSINGDTVDVDTETYTNVERSGEKYRRFR